MKNAIRMTATYLIACGIVLCMSAASMGGTIGAASDIDADGVADHEDNAIANLNPGQGDQDQDGLGDVDDPFPFVPDSDADGIDDGPDAGPTNASIGLHTVSLGGPYSIDPGDTLGVNVTFGPIAHYVALVFDLGDDGPSDGYATISTSGNVDIPASFFVDSGNWDLNTPGTYDLSVELVRHTGTATDSTTVTVTPEPASMSLLVLGGMALLRRRRKR
ncbi:MAG: PEP-CTERM sorting domain-containing protein [Phycisphaerae bacterium]|nr:PEP-CTERM sorting domain-containing protein [Phycisphaerae bacterium]